MSRDFTKKNDIKKSWLLLSIACEFIIPLMILSLLLMNFSVSTKIQDSIGAYILNFLIGVIVFLILFNGSYKKHNTAFLTFYIFASLLSITFTIWKLTAGIISVLQALQEANQDWSSVPLLATLLFGLALSSIICKSFWCYVSWKLRALNKSYQESEILNSPVYQLQIQEICNASDATTLAEIYGKGVRNHPEIASFLKKYYKSRLQSLNISPPTSYTS